MRNSRQLGRWANRKGSNERLRGMFLPLIACLSSFLPAALSLCLAGSLLVCLAGCSGLKLPAGPVVPTVPVSGRVLESGLLEDKPLSGARVVINGSAPVLTDSDGRFLADVPVPTASGASLRVVVTVAKHGYSTHISEASVSSSGGDVGNIYLVPVSGSSSLGGRVVEKGSGRPIPAAEVQLLVSGGASRRTITAADGSFLLSGITPPEGEFGLRARHPDYLAVLNPQTGELTVTVNLRSGDERINSVIVELFPLGTPTRLTGSVFKGETLEPVANATVWVGDKRGTTDVNGNFVISDAPTGGQVPVRVEPPDTTLQPLTENLTINGEPLLLFLGTAGSQLPPFPFTIAGKVTLEGESNHSGVRVEALRDGSVVDAAITDVDGRYQIWLPPGTYTLRASHDGFQTVTQTVRLLPGMAVRDVNFTLPRQSAKMSRAAQFSR
jgi:hypothetical protein